jgi:hypothetical protein
MVLVADKIELLVRAPLLRIQATEADQVILVLITQDQLVLEEIEVDPAHLEQELVLALELAPLVQLVVAAQAAMEQVVVVALVQVALVQVVMELAAVLVHPAHLEHMVADPDQQDHRAAELALLQVEPIWAKAKEIIPVQ